MGSTVVPFTIPALDSTGQTNVSSDIGGTLRFWFEPAWSSQSQAGTGPETNAVLVEFDAASGGETAFAWSLEVSADGNTLALLAQTGSGIESLIQTQIGWQTNESHCLVLEFSSSGSVLYVDGQAAGQGAGVPSVPPSVGELTIGSTISGTNAAEGDLEEIYSFNYWPSNADVAAYYGMTYQYAAQGPVSLVGGSGFQLGGGTADSIHSPGNVYDPNNDTPCSPGGPVYITSVVATPQTNGNMTVSFAIQGGTNGVFYDIFATTILNASLDDYQWTWIGQGETCNNYTFSNQPPGQAYYVLELSAETMTVAFGSNTYGQCQVPFGLTNAIAVAAGGYFSLAITNGKVVAWGDNTYGETNIPAGLSNVVAIAAGLYHGVAVMANGSVTNWGYYWDGGANYASVTNRTYANAPPLSNVVAVAAGMGQDLALLSNGIVVAWGFTNVYGTGAAYGTMVPTNLNLTNVSGIACGWQFNVALSSNGTVTAWGYNDPYFGYPTNVPGTVGSNAVAVAAGGNNAAALLKNGTVVAWGDPYSGVTNVPSSLTNVVAVSTGGNAGFALLNNGTGVTWGGAQSVLTTNIPIGMAGVKAISSGFEHNLAILSGIMNPLLFVQPTNEYSAAAGTVTFSAEGQAPGIEGVQYQWQFNGTNIGGATNATLTLTNVGASNNGSYDVIVYTSIGSIKSSDATFTLELAPVIVNTNPPTGPVLD